MIGECETCGRENVPVAKVNGFACETVACFICQGDIADPYGEIELDQRMNALVTDWEDVDQKTNVVPWCDACQSNHWPNQCNPDLDEQRIPR